MGGLTVPLGFVRTKNYRSEDQNPDYGYEQAYVIIYYIECVCCDARAILLYTLLWYFMAINYVHSPHSCYLNHSTSFVWSLLVPVILIFLANIGFFIMAIVIMYRHQKRQNTDDKKHKIKWVLLCPPPPIKMHNHTWNPCKHTHLITHSIKACMYARHAHTHTSTYYNTTHAINFNADNG